jgi:hypothetical protein
MKSYFVMVPQFVRRIKSPFGPFDSRETAKLWADRVIGQQYYQIESSLLPQTHQYHVLVNNGDVSVSYCGPDHEELSKEQSAVRLYIDESIFEVSVYLMAADLEEAKIVGIKLILEALETGTFLQESGIRFNLKDFDKMVSKMKEAP